MMRCFIQVLACITSSAEAVLRRVAESNLRELQNERGAPLMSTMA
jgi:hypothetical protein